MMMKEKIIENLKTQAENFLTLTRLEYASVLEKAVLCQVDALKSGGKILIAGNGGSAADSQHFAAELVGRFLKERKGLPSVALTTDSSILTSVANDYGYDEVFSRQIEALGKKGDVFIGISTSGNSMNILKAIQKAKSIGIKTIGLLGKDGGKIAKACDYSVIIPLDFTPRIQEMHTFTVHIMCEMIENSFSD